jgi:ribonuclease PH
LRPRLIGRGTLSTESLASFSPKPITSRIAVNTFIMFAPAEIRVTVYEVVLQFDGGLRGAAGRWACHFAKLSSSRFHVSVLSRSEGSSLTHWSITEVFLSSSCWCGWFL